MNLLIDINHPSHVHLFKNFIDEMTSRNHNVFVTAKEEPSIIQLLNLYNIPFIGMGRRKDAMIGKILKQFRDTFILYKQSKRLKIDLAMGSSISVPQLSVISSFRSVMFDDDDDDAIPFVVRFAHPFASCLLSPGSIQGNRKRKETVFYKGFHELSYLHPKRFNPDRSVLDELLINPNQPYFLMRFNSFKAHHDFNESGLTLNQKLQLIELLSSKGQIFITTERTMEAELSPYSLNISPEKIHSLLYYATLFIGDSQTMTSEAAILGTPALKCNTFAGKLSVPNEIENQYGLCFSYQPFQFEEMIIKIKDLLTMSNLKEEWQKRRQRMLTDKIDVTAFMIWFIENYPVSARIMRESPDYQYRFK